MTLPADSIHGPSHWRRVYQIGMYLAKSIGRNVMVISLFACLHDSQRENEWDDPLHGIRAARYTQRLYDEGLLDLNRVHWPNFFSPARITAT